MTMLKVAQRVQEAARRHLNRTGKTVQLLALTRRNGVAPVNVRTDRERDARRRSAALVLAAVMAGAAGAGAMGFSTNAAAEAAREGVTQVDAPRYLSSVDEFLFPEIQPYSTGMLKVSDKHSLYYEECGNPLGKPVIMVHGGPGGGCSDGMRRYHDPRKYRIILLDQRGSGRSLPHASLEDNTCASLAVDEEK
jgi:proline iminopeptidase